MGDSFYGNLFSNMKPKPKGFTVGKSTIDLTPEVYRSAVKSRQMKKNWIMANASVFALCVLTSSLLFVSNAPIKAQLDTATNSTEQLLTALEDYKAQEQMIEKAGPIRKQLNSAAGSEIDWSELITSIEQTLPSGISIKSIGINADGAPSSDPKKPGKGAAVLVSFSASSPLGYADTLRSVQSADGVSRVEIGGMTSSGESYEFSATFDYDDQILTNKFPSTKNSGGN